MTGFDPELYLRLLGERWLLGGNLNPGRDAGCVSAAGAALAAAGALDRDRAASVSEEYLQAALLRSGGGSRHHRLHSPEPAAPATEPLAPGAMFPGQITVETGDWHLELLWVSCGADATQLGVRGASTAAHRRHSSPPQLDVRVSDGGRLSAQFSGSWGSDGLRGIYRIGAPLPPGVEWIDVESRRIPLEQPTPARPVVLEALPAQSAGIRYLWQLLADFGTHPGSPGLDPAIDALLAAGVLSADDPQLEAIGWVASNYRDGRLRLRRGASRAAPPPVVSPGGHPIAVPEEWVSVLTRPRAAGPVGTLLVGATTPLFDGLSVAVNALVSDHGGWTLDVDTVGVPHIQPFASALAWRPLAWWAFDDRANHYLGTMAGGTSDGERWSAQIGFAALDPRASRLTLAPTGASTRALIEVPLEWP